MLKKKKIITLECFLDADLLFKQACEFYNLSYSLVYTIPSKDSS